MKMIDLLEFRYLCHKFIYDDIDLLLNNIQRNIECFNLSYNEKEKSIHLKVKKTDFKKTYKAFNTDTFYVCMDNILLNFFKEYQSCKDANSNIDNLIKELLYDNGKVRLLYSVIFLTDNGEVIIKL